MIVVLMEMQPVDLDHTIVCSDRDIFTEVDLIILQTRDGCHVPHPRKTMEFLPHRVLSIQVSASLCHGPCHGGAGHGTRV